MVIFYSTGVLMFLLSIEVRSGAELSLPSSQETIIEDIRKILFINNI